MQRILDRLGKKAGVGYRVTPHGVRRTSCRFGIQQGETIHQASKRLRHKDIRVTEASYAVQVGTADIDRVRVSALMANMTR